MFRYRGVADEVITALRQRMAVMAHLLMKRALGPMAALDAFFGVD
jgi:hypothetical protein